MLFYFELAALCILVYTFGVLIGRRQIREEAKFWDVGHWYLDKYDRKRWGWKRRD